MRREREGRQVKEKAVTRGYEGWASADTGGMERRGCLEVKGKLTGLCDQLDPGEGEGDTEVFSHNKRIKRRKR